MATVSEVAIEYRARGAQAAQRADQSVRDSISTTAQTARQESGEINRWMDRHKTAIQQIGIATAAVMGAVLSASPTLRAELSGIRTAFSLFADTIVRDVLPGTGTLTEVALDLAMRFREWDSPLRSVISHLLIFAALLLPIVKVGSILIGTLGTLAGWFATAAGVLGSLIAGSTAAAVALGALLGLIGVGILEVSGFLDVVEDLGRWVGDRLPDSLVDLSLVLLTAFLAPLTIIGAAIRGFVQGVLDDGLRGGVEGAIQGVEDALDVFIGAWRRTLSRVGSLLWSFGRGLVDLGIRLLRWLASGIRSGARWVWDRITGLTDGVLDRLPSLSGMHTLGEDILSALASGIRSGASDVWDSVEDVAGGIRDRFPFSDARTGPLSDFTTIPSTMADTLSSFADDPQLERAGDTAGAALHPTTGVGGGGGGGGDRIEIIFETGAIQVGGGGRRAGDEVADQVSTALERQLGSRGV